MTRSHSSIARRFSRLLTFLAASLWLLSSPAFAEPEKLSIGGLEVMAWLPERVPSAPVILFSHGFGGCHVQSTPLMERFAQAGYAVFAPNHQDAACGKVGRRPAIPFEKPELWSDTTYSDRGADIQNLITELMKEPRFAGLDWKKLGMAGHSLGGYTALGLAGAWPSWKDNRIKAIAVYSPYAPPYIVHKTLSGVSGIPVMYQGGTRDHLTPYITQTDGAYQQTPTPRFYVEFNGAPHSAWAGKNSRFYDDIAAYSIAFFDFILRSEPFPSELNAPHKKVKTAWNQL
jgi:dienelactone hydrolase